MKPGRGTGLPVRVFRQRRRAHRCESRPTGALTVTALTGTTDENAGLGSAVLTSVQQLGGAVGLAVLVALATQRRDALAASLADQRAVTEGFSFALRIAAALVVLGAVLIATMLRDTTRPATQKAVG
ncbi:hypothetical protein [Nocardia uniformis]|uniref:hypothetical protein n=1 Tax=Nocardia uniformis TaxID=53432 RepID=UPI0008341E3C|nr:hypothetical protein [Nocardia uniformis]